MDQKIVRLLGLGILLLASGCAPKSWTRHFHQEQVEGRTLFVVTDVPSDKKYLPKLIHRKSYAASERDLFLKDYDRLKVSGHPLENDQVLIKTDNPLWPIERQWTSEEEILFNQWIAENANTEILVGSGVVVDCADLAMTLRWIYSHERRLPAANTLSPTEGLMGSWQSTTEWDRLPTATEWKKDERFKAALRYLLAMGYTHTIIGDLYPVALKAPYAGVGTVYLTLADESGHTRTIISSGESEKCGNRKCVRVIYGNLPAEEEVYEDEEFPYPVPEGQGGLFRFRWPEQNENGVWSLRPARLMPGFSRAQFIIEEFEYVSQLGETLGLFTNATEAAIMLGDVFIQTLLKRSAVVAEGYIFCKINSCEPGSRNYDEYSTPSRDSRLRRNLLVLRNLLVEADQKDVNLKYLYERLREQAIVTNYPISIYDVIFNLDPQTFTSDPRDESYKRWGLAQKSDILNSYWQTGIFALTYNSRANKVGQALSLCRNGNREDQITCDPLDPAVRKLDTTDFDKALRLQRDEIVKGFNNLSEPDRWRVTSRLARMYTGIFGCDTYYEYCTYFELLIQVPEFINNMTSDPTDTYNHRIGMPFSPDLRNKQ